MVGIGVAVVVVVSVLAVGPHGGSGPSSSAHPISPWPAAPPLTPHQLVRLPVAEYTESTVELPGFDPLYGYVHGNNCVPGASGGCFSGGTDYSEIPVLSSDAGQPFGVYYVNNASDLVEYELPNGPLRTVAPVTPLYQTYAAYGGMLPNEFTIEYGYGTALFFGTVRPGAPDVTVETVDLQSGAVRLVNTSVAISAWNQGALYVGNDTVLVISAVKQPVGAITEVNMTTGREWSAATLPFFEANNIYWLPQRQQLINVEAEGSTGDRVQQLNASIVNGSLVFTSVALLTVESGLTVNWVNGIAYNASVDEIAFAEGGLGVDDTVVLHYDSTGRLVTAGEKVYSGGRTNVMIQRYAYTSDYVMAGYVDGNQYLFDPWNGSTIGTNEPFTQHVPIVCDGSCFLGTYGPSMTDLIDWHASVARNDPFWSVVLARQVA